MSDTPRISVERLIELGAGYSCVSIEDILCKRRLIALAHIRFAICFVATEAGWSQPKIGKAMGGRDASTISHAISRASYMLDRLVDEFTDLVDSLSEHAKAVSRGDPEPETDWLVIPGPTIPPVPAVRRMSININSQRKLRNELCPDDDDAMMRLRGSRKLIAAIRREHPERCLAA